ncbi:RNA polymerase-binding protein RbpA [Dermacoccus nishinomiyaensis]|uniref:RNA polymerase-binding protein RbpA n=1 Tax=Dermacoccus nishinomiyaensis TaxID=1274 RepID=UPI0030D625BC
MAERSLRGTNLSTLSLETDEGIAFSERQMVSDKCAQGHVIELPFSVEADVPALWECRCGLEALLVDGPEPDRKPTKPARTHWDMLLERRSVEELEELLDERLTLLRESRGEKPKRKRAAASK